MVAFCPHCGSIMERPIFPTVKQQIYDFLLRNVECTTKEIKEHLYGAHANLYTGNGISVHLSQMKSTLRANGLKIISSRGPGARYKIVEMKVCKNVPF